MRPFCAVCTEYVSEPVKREPLGRHGAMVVVCPTCATQPIEKPKHNKWWKR